MIGSTVLRYETVTSTNDIAKELASSGGAEGTLVVAAEQTKGRGSRGRGWLSPPGANLYASVILKPEIPSARYPELAFVAAVALVRAMRGPFGLDAWVKWPNDVLVDGGKIAGILVEVTKDAAIIGIGVNVNWTNLPDEIASTATSMRVESGHRIDLEAVLSALAAELDAAYGAYRESGFGRTLNDWMGYQQTIGRTVTVECDGETVTGLALDIDCHGGLMLRLSDGSVRTISAGIIIGAV